MNPSQSNSREFQWLAIDAEVKSLEESIWVLKHRRNTLVPVSSLPPGVIATIFSFLRLLVTSTAFLPGETPERLDPLAWLRVAHVCHRWREIALNRPLFWSYVDFTTFTSAGAAEILTRAKKTPLHLEARVPHGHWDEDQFSAFAKELQPRVSHICHLGVSAGTVNLRRILEGLTSSAPILEYLSLAQIRTLASHRP